MEKGKLAAIRCVASVVVLSALFMAYFVIEEAATGFTGNGFDPKAIPHCCCEDTAWIFRSTTHYLIYAGSFTTAFLLCAATGVFAAVRASVITNAIAVVVTGVSLYCLLQIRACG